MDSDSLLAKVALAIVFMVVVFGGIYCQCTVWNECRNNGSSWLYCYHLVGR